MPRLTAKYIAAVNTAHNHRLQAINTRNQEELYTLLQENGFTWNSQTEVWEKTDRPQAKPPETRLTLTELAELIAYVQVELNQAEQDLSQSHRPSQKPAFQQRIDRKKALIAKLRQMEQEQLNRVSINGRPGRS